METIGEIVVSVAGVWASLILVALSFATQSYKPKIVLIILGTLFLLMQGGCCAFFANFDRNLGGSGKSLMFPITVVGAIVFLVLSGLTLKTTKNENANKKIDHYKSDALI